MEAGVEVGEETEHPPEPDRPRPAEDLARRRAGEGRDEEDERGQAETVQGLGDRVGAERSPRRLQPDRGERRERGGEDGGLEPRPRSAAARRRRSRGAQKNRARSIPA